MATVNWSGVLKPVYLLTVLVVQCSASLNPACECVTFQSLDRQSEQRFTSPNYPAPYRQAINCILYAFTAPVGHIVELHFTDLDLGELRDSGSCSGGDILRIYQNLEQPDINENTHWNSQVCGNLSTLSTRSFFSSGRVLVIEFGTDGDTAPHRGFSGLYHFHRANQFATDGVLQIGTPCTYYIDSALYKTGKFFSPRYPQNYRENQICAWMLNGDFDERVQVSFLSIDLATQAPPEAILYPKDRLINAANSPNRSCDPTSPLGDHIVVYNWDNSDAPVIRRLCGRQSHVEIMSTGKRMLVTFISDQYVQTQGFAAVFHFIKERSAPTPLVKCDRYFNSSYAKKGIITSPSYPKKYPPGIKCKYDFSAANDERVVIRFHDFDLYPLQRPNESCKFSDSLTALILSHSTIIDTLATFCGSDLPPSIMSNGPWMSLVFDAQSAVSNAHGFNISYEFVDDFGIKADDRIPHLPCYLKYDSSVSIQGEVVSPNYPGLYPRDTECNYLFFGKGKSIMLNFTYFDVRGQPPECKEEDYSDYVLFSNFDRAEDKKMSRLCSMGLLSSYVISPPVYSDTDYFRLTFKSDSSIDGTGFRASYTFFTPNSATIAAGQTDNEVKAANNADITKISLCIMVLIVTSSIKTL